MQRTAFQVGVDFTIRERNGGGNYPPVGCQASLDAASASPGETVNVQALCFQDEVQFSFGPQNLALGRVNADSNGVASLSFVVPDVPVGDDLFKATGKGRDGVAAAMSATLAVTKPNERAVVAPVSVAPATPPGNSAEASGGVESSVPVEVLGAVEVATPRPASRGGLLAFTGTDVASLVRTALVIAAVGGILLLATRRKRHLHRMAR